MSLGACGVPYQQQRRVDVDVLEHNELFLGFHREQPRALQLSFHPVPHAAVFPLEGRGQSPDRQEGGGGGGSRGRQRGSESGAAAACWRCHSHLRQVEAEGKLVQAGVQHRESFLRTVLV